MLAMGFAAGQLWRSTLGFPMPSYLAGVIGGHIGAADLGAAQALGERTALKARVAATASRR